MKHRSIRAALALAVMIGVCFACLPCASAGTLATFDWETAAVSGAIVWQTVNVGGTMVTAVVSAQNVVGDSVYVELYDTISYGTYGSITSGQFVCSSMNSDVKMTIVFSAPVDVLKVHAVEMSGDNGGTWTYTPTGGTNSVVTDIIAGGQDHWVYLNWTGVTQIEVTTSNALSSFGFDDLVLGTQDDATPPTLASVTRDSNTQLTVTLSESCQNLVKANDCGFTVTRTGGSQTYSVSGTGAYGDGTKIFLFVDDMSTAAGAGVTVTYTAGGNGTVIDTAGNPMATDAVGVAAAAWDILAPTVISINRQDPLAAVINAANFVFRVTFSEGVTGVDMTDFSASVTGSLYPSLSKVEKISDSVYDVYFHVVSGEGTVKLNLSASGTGIKDIGGTPIATGFTSGQTYTVDTTAPTVTSIDRYDPLSEVATASTVTFRVTFSEGVNNVGILDFSTHTTGSLSASVSSFYWRGASVYDLEVNINSGQGTLRLDLNDSGTGITDLAGNDIAGGFTGGQTYSIDKQGPSLSGAVRISDTQLSVTLSEASQNLAKANDGGFTVKKTGTGTAYAVSATAQGTDASHVALTVADMATAGSAGVTVTYTAGTNGTIADLTGNAMATDSTGVAVPPWDTDAPRVSGVARQTPADETTNASALTFRVTFSEAVTGVDASDFALVKTGSADGAVFSVSAVGGSVYDVTVNTVSGAGTLRLDVNASGTNITDTGGMPISGGYSEGQTYTIDQAPPVMTGAVKNGSTQIVVSFSEDCRNLTKANDGGFTVTQTGTATAYAVSAVQQGADTGHAALTVADLTSAGSAGVTVTYTAGGNGTVADLAGNALATDGTGVSIAAWDTAAPTIVSVVRDSDTQITVNLSEPVFNVAKPNDGGFTVTQTGTGIAFAVTNVAQGSAILTVANMASAGVSGVTVAYTAGGNGTITDLSGNPLGTLREGVGVRAWGVQEPQTGDPARPALWLLLLLGSGLAAGYGFHRRVRRGRAEP